VRKEKHLYGVFNKCNGDTISSYPRWFCCVTKTRAALMVQKKAVPTSRPAAEENGRFFSDRLSVFITVNVLPLIANCDMILWNCNKIVVCCLGEINIITHYVNAQIQRSVVMRLTTKPAYRPCSGNNQSLSFEEAMCEVERLFTNEGKCCRCA